MEADFTVLGQLAAFAFGAIQVIDIWSRSSDFVRRLLLTAIGFGLIAWVAADLPGLRFPKPADKPSTYGSSSYLR